ncbi:MAG: nucleoside-diphosphate kinase [Candidatus Harrisonbacteria bacterium RIFCSPLOWO2_02_FULL_41_11]|uniref:nucleoside-diphosphate kinase n=1 Tax=Candidatus Harrisonbacteria bacterium RIFCSPHIGHO2_02_FULL_42_16 TaxID=1798404 RepID=A0A1G1ZJ73_9BACT|nr:MAG: nucleoside-diphosphate kinase [Candidatus Harrisonbacteria bacterium RIFCSPHIGHO2_02_FULL_42_16]OGY66550.1 MAG: nucleoside-diphosphate kinase [Candidatus Harrisonbacteria bacterium RIFCSPLOWO2_02_FULL_41_11]
MNKKERTLVLLKPDAVQRNLTGEIISRFERVGLKIVAMKLVLPTEEQALTHYRINPNLPEKILNHLKTFLSASPVVAMVLEGNKAIPVVRKLIGSTEPLKSDVGTIRGDFTLDSYDLADADGRAVRNLVHASASESDAEQEIKVWFEPEELVNYKSVREKILYDVNLDSKPE